MMIQNNMRICVISPVYPPYASGMGNIAHQYASWAKSAGFEVTVLTPLYKKQNTENQDEVVYVKPMIAYGNAAWMHEFPYPVQPDIIHLHVPFIGGIGAVKKLISRFPEALLVITYHMDLVAKDWRLPFFWGWKKWALPWIAKHTDIIHVTSHDYFKHSDLAKYIAKDDPRVVAIGLPVQDQTQPEKKWHEKNNLELLMVCALDKAHDFKGVERAIRCMANLPDTITLTIVGEGSMRKHYESLVKKLHLEKKVMFTGRVSDATLDNLYRKKDVLLAPSISSSEAFGLTLIEAQARGTLVIASDLPGVRSVFNHNKTGYLISTHGISDLKNAILKIQCMDKQDKARMSQQAYMYAKKYFTSRIKPAILDVYNKKI